jgi:hypothetical protein
MLKTGRFLAIVTVAAAATLGGLAAWAAPMTSPVAPLQGGSLVTNAGYSCWWEHGGANTAGSAAAAITAADAPR